MNQTRLNQLPQALKARGYVAAALITETGERYEFLCNPSRIDNTKRAIYNSADIPLHSVQPLQYSRSEGTEKTFPDLILDGWANQRSVAPLIKELENLMVADIERKEAPKSVTFSWGKYSFGPAVLTEMNWTESAWLDGLEGFVMLSFTLKEIPQGTQNPSTTSEQNDLEFSPLGETITGVFSDRQRNDAIQGAIAFVESNLNSLDNVARRAYQIGDFDWNVNESGEVSILDRSGTSLATLGTWLPDDFDFRGLI